MIVSILSTQLKKDLIIYLIKVDVNSIQSKLLEPLINAFVYAHTYKLFIV